MRFCDRIRTRREELNISQDELARRMGYKSRSTINKIELGINDVSQSKIVLLAKALNTTIGYLMGDQDNPSIEVSTLAPPILTKYSKLNDIGQRKTEAYIDDLLAVPLYRKDSASDEDLKLVAETPVSIKPKINDEPEHT